MEGPQAGLPQGPSPRGGCGWVAWIIAAVAAVSFLLCFGILGLRVLQPALAARLHGPAGVSPGGSLARRPSGNVPGTTVHTGVQALWEREGPLSGVTVDTKLGRAYAGTQSAWEQIDASGATVAAFATPAGSVCLRAARLTGANEADILAFQYWRGTVYAYRADGAELWTHSVDLPIDEVTPADLDGDGRDEVLLGLGGTGGMLALSSGGLPLWQNMDIGEVAFITAGDIDGDGRADVVASTATQGTMIVSADGRSMRPERRFDFTGYARAVTCPVAKRGVRWIVTGQGPDGEAVAGFGADGKCRWKTKLPAGEPTSGTGPAEFAMTRPWLALASNHGILRVIDLDTGAIIAKLQEAGSGPILEVAWLEEPGKAPILLTADGKALRAFEVTPVTDGPPLGTVESGPGLLPPKVEAPAEAESQPADAEPSRWVT